jgi:bifunctional non-homologous end joining protein LigD
MLATAGIPKGIDGWAAEPKLDGWRARVLVDGDGLQVRTRSGRVITESVPAAQGLRGLRAVLDGELVADSGRLSDFYRLGPALAVKQGRRVPVAFVAFDLLWQDGEMLVDRPWSARREALEDLGLPARRVPVASAYGWEQIPDLFQACAALGVEGIVLKDLKARYQPGKRSDAWRKVKCEAWGEHRLRRLTMRDPPTPHDRVPPDR